MLILMLLARVRNVMPRAFEIPLMSNELLVMHKIERQIPCKERDFWKTATSLPHTCLQREHVYSFTSENQ